MKFVTMTNEDFKIKSNSFQSCSRRFWKCFSHERNFCMFQSLRSLRPRQLSQVDNSTSEHSPQMKVSLYADLFILFGFSCFAYEPQLYLFVKAVQWYFPQWWVFSDSTNRQAIFKGLKRWKIVVFRDGSIDWSSL